MAIAKSRPTQIQFINCSASAKATDSKDKAVIRSYATSYQWKQASKKKARGTNPVRRRPRTDRSPSKSTTDSSEDDRAVNTHTNSPPDPSGILGAGFVDPFGVFSNSAELGRRSVGEFIHYLLPHTRNLFAATLGDGSEGGSFSSMWYMHMYDDPLLLDGLLLGSAAVARHYGSIPDARMVFDKLHGRVIKHIRHRISTLDTEPLDPDNDVLLQLMTIHIFKTSFTTEKLRSREGGPRQGPLQNLQCLQFYAYMEPPPSAMAAMVAVMNSMPSLEDTLRTRGLAQTMSFGTIQHALKTLSKPVLPFIRINQDFDASEVFGSVSNSIRTHSGFSVMKEEAGQCENFSQLLANLENARRYTSLVEDYVKRTCAPTNLSEMADRRNWLQHNILSLPTTTPTRCAMYEAIRSALLIYSVLIIMPLPLEVAPLNELSDQIGDAIQRLNVSSMPEKWLSLAVWAATMGSLAAYDSSKRSWHLGLLQRLCQRQGLQSWHAYREELMRFLWMPNVNDPDGRALWLEIGVSPVNSETSAAKTESDSWAPCDPGMAYPSPAPSEEEKPEFVIPAKAMSELWADVDRYLSSTERQMGISEETIRCA